MTLQARAATAGAVVWLLLAAGCSDNDPVPSPTPGTSTGSPEPTATSTTSPTETAEPTDGPAPATGPLLKGQSSQLRAPEGWRKHKGLTSYVHPAARPGPSPDKMQLFDHVSIVADSTPLDDQAKAYRTITPDDARIERLPDVDLDGTMAFHLRWTIPGDPVVNYAVGTIRNGRAIALDVQLSARTNRTQPDLMESILLTFEWR